MSAACGLISSSVMTCCVAETLSTLFMALGDHISYDRHDYEDDIHTPISDHSAISSSQSSTNRLSVAGNRPVSSVITRLGILYHSPSFLSHYPDQPLPSVVGGWLNRTLPGAVHDIPRHVYRIPGTDAVCLPDRFIGCV